MQQPQIAQTGKIGNPVALPVLGVGVPTPRRGPPLAGVFAHGHDASGVDLDVRALTPRLTESFDRLRKLAHPPLPLSSLGGTASPSGTYAGDSRRGEFRGTMTLQRSRVRVNLRQRRAQAGLSQPALAKLLGPTIERQHISRWESPSRGGHMPSPEHLEALAKALGCDVGWFFADHGYDYDSDAAAA